MICIGILALATIAFHQNRIENARAIERAKFAEGQRVREELVRDFHDEVGSRASLIFTLSKRLSQDIPKVASKSTDVLDKVAQNAGGLTSIVREFIQEYDPKNNTIHHLAIHLETFAEDLFEDSDISFKMTELKDNWKKINLPTGSFQNLARIFKEGMNNANKHAQGCQNVLLHIVFSKSILEITLTDDGKGFDPAEDFSGNGLRNMHSRAIKIGGELQITSGFCMGTRIYFLGKLC